MDNIEKLYDNIFTESTITCNKCGHQDELMADSIDAASVWNHAGWVVVREKVYCPECDSKRKEKNRARKKPAKKKKPAHR